MALYFKDMHVHANNSEPYDQHLVSCDILLFLHDLLTFDGPCSMMSAGNIKIKTDGK